MKALFVTAAALLALGGCSYLTEGVDAARPYAAPALAEAYAFRCNTMSVDQRMMDYAAFQAALDKKYPGMMAPIFDCDNDGSPDFTPADVDAFRAAMKS